ncbi:MAG: peptidoglycan-binding domain-containing protein [Candidatus Azambacteria bacterium]|nr:peptidoglycan-binding domain-containing protein [Candidatus Azambacteria bacterium]
MSYKRFIFLGLFLAAGFLFFNVPSARAITRNWNGGGDGVTWTDRANWGGASNLLYPGQNAADDVIIASSTSALGPLSVYATSTIAFGVNTLQVQNGWKLYIGGTLGASSTVSIMGTSTLALATTTFGAGTLNLGQTDAGAPLMLPATATFTPATGTVAYIGGGTANITVATTTFYNLTLSSTSTAATAAIRTYKFGSGNTVAQSATTTVSNVFYVATSTKADFNGITDLLLSGSGTPFSKTYGDFMQSSKIVYSSTSATNIATGTYANLELIGAATKTLLGNTTATSTITVPSGATLAVSTFTFTATDATWTNSGTVTEGTGGKIVLAGVGVLSDSAGGSATGGFGNADDGPVIHIQITDTSLNLVSATAETQTATVTGTSGITDSETVTLTETTVSSGIFRGSLGFQLSGSDVAGKLDYQGPGSLTYTWTDSQDTADTETAPGVFTGTTPGGGGGGGAVAAVTPATPAVPTTPAVSTGTPAVPATPATPATPAAPSLDNVSSKIASVVAKIAALTKSSPAADIAAVQAEILAILNDIQAIQAAQPAPSGVALGFNFVRPLALGLRHSDVNNLQQALKTDSSIYPEGLVTGYFGPATLRAIQKFQEKYGIAALGDPGYGTVGPKTRAKLNELYGNK